MASRVHGARAIGEEAAQSATGKNWSEWFAILDAYLIATALDHGCPLLALDGGLLHAARAAGVATIEVNP